MGPYVIPVTKRGQIGGWLKIQLYRLEFRLLVWPLELPSLDFKNCLCHLLGA